MTITAKELDLFHRDNDGVSDIDYAWNPITQKFDRPSIEWDGPFGKHWQRFDSEEQLEAALEKHREFQKRWVAEYRKSIIKKGKEIAEKRRKLKEAKTLGGNFPILKTLLEEMR